MGIKDLFDRPGQGGDTLLRTALEPTLQPGEELVGMLMATRRFGMKPQTYALGVTGNRLILAPTSAKDGLPTLSMDRSDITGSSVKHTGLGVRLLSDANASRVTIQSRTQGEVKLTLIWTTSANGSSKVARHPAWPRSRTSSPPPAEPPTPRSAARVSRPCSICR